MPDLTNPSTIAQQTQQALGNAQNSISGVGTTVLNDATGSIQGVVGGIAGKLSAAGSTVAGAASAAFNQLGSAVSTVTKFKDTLGVAEKIREIRPEGTRGRLTKSGSIAISVGSGTLLYKIFF
jgi:hypothetical protein